MKTKCIAVRSVTYAQKAKDILKQHGINSTLYRRSDPNRTGCGWCIKIADTQAKNAYSLLRSNGVAVTGEIYDIS